MVGPGDCAEFVLGSASDSLASLCWLFPSFSCSQLEGLGWEVPDCPFLVRCPIIIAPCGHSYSWAPGTPHCTSISPSSPPLCFQVY